MKFGQLPLGDADKTQKQLKHLVYKTVQVTQASLQSHLEVSNRFNVVAVKVYGSETHSLVDMGAVPNLISWGVCERLPLAPVAAEGVYKIFFFQIFHLIQVLI